MAKNKLNSLLPLWLYVILKEKSSSQNPLSRSEIEDTLTKNYHVTIGEEDRNKTKRYINALCEYFKEIEYDDAIEETTKTIKDAKGRDITVPAWYLNAEKAPQMMGGNLSVGEVNFLTDVLSANKTISSECTNALIHKLAESLGDPERKELRIKKHAQGEYKSENLYLYEIRNTVEQAIADKKHLAITYEINGKEKDWAITPIKIDSIDGECFILAYRSKKLERFYLERIKFVYPWKDRTENIDDDKYVESENVQFTKSIALDALFSNTREINHAIKNNKYLTFTYLSYCLEKDTKVKLTPSSPQTVIPVNTAYKDGKPYLIAIDPQNEYTPVFYRIDLIKDIKSDGNVNYMEYRKFDVKDSNEYTDKHPFMLSGFTKIRATFLIKADSLDRVVDAFGNKVTFIGQDKAFESAGENASKLARAYPKLNFSHYLGFDHNETLVKFTVETTDEEAVRFALQNGDVAELESPAPLRGRILDIVAKMEARHKKVKR